MEPKPLPALPPPGRPGKRPPQRAEARKAIGKTPKFTRKQEIAIDILRSDATDIAFGGGSRSGKTFLFVYAICIRAIRAPGSRHAILRFRLNAVLASIAYVTLPLVMNLFWPGLYDRCKFEKQRGVFVFPNGSEIWYCGLDDKERTEKILGLEFVTMYFNESSQIPYQSIVLAESRLAQVIPGMAQKAFYDFNPPSKRHWTFKKFVERVNPDNPRQPLADAHLVQFLYMNPADNEENLTTAYINRLKNMPTRARNRFLLGKFADDSEGTLWDEGLLDLCRVHHELPDFVRVVIAVDPSGCSGPADTRSDEVGIIVVALGTNGMAYVLEDLSGKHGPKQWSGIVWDAWERHSADVVVAEANFGGAMVESVLNALGKKDLNVKMVFASRGKVVRAEPISALYGGRAGSKILHNGVFPELEQQMCDFTVAGYEGPASPDRADALVFAMTELFPGIVKPRDTSNNSRGPAVPVRYRPRTASSFRRR
jgi:hypothetical protein